MSWVPFCKAKVAGTYASEPTVARLRVCTSLTTKAQVLGLVPFSWCPFRAKKSGCLGREKHALIFGPASLVLAAVAHHFVVQGKG